MARVSVTSNGFFSPSRTMVSVILVPAAPRILSMESFSGTPAMEAPSMPTMRSPDLMPARLAGVPSIGEITLMKPSSLRHLDADTAELTLGGDLHVAIHLGVHVAGMGIEVGDHALDGGVDQFAVFHGAHIVGAHALERVAEQIELAIGGRVIGALGLGQRDHRRGETADQTQTNKRKFLHVRFAFPNAGRKFNFSHGAGDWPRPP